jgi:hypothetical protein
LGQFFHVLGRRIKSFEKFFSAHANLVEEIRLLILGFLCCGCIALFFSSEVGPKTGIALAQLLIGNGEPISDEGLQSQPILIDANQNVVLDPIDLASLTLEGHIGANIFLGKIECVIWGASG